MKALSGSRVLSRIHQLRFWRNTNRFLQEARITHPVLPIPLSSQQHRFASSKKTSKADEDPDAPLSYTSSKALDWSVHNSYGRHKKQPWYKVAPISIGLSIFIAWIFLRKETDIDRQLEKHLHERLPHMFPPPAEVPEDETLLNEEEEKTITE
ncbi:ubiquinol-cytochrome c reductase complex assembly factor 4-like [Asterias amurensis]|uniref:ubiquinol-cytochrome c reductase complex assembly factor 4-like n=1 Tax=Asterias amurensis TaxID=7602 RepID=UPI003AB83F8F